MTLLAGQLLKISWHAAYLVYLLFVPTLLFIFFVPDLEKAGIKKQADEMAAAQELLKKWPKSMPAVKSSSTLPCCLPLLRRHGGYSSWQLCTLKTASALQARPARSLPARTLPSCWAGRLRGALCFEVQDPAIGDPALRPYLVAMAMTTSNGVAIALGIASGFFGGVSTSSSPACHNCPSPARPQ